MVRTTNNLNNYGVPIASDNLSKLSRLKSSSAKKQLTKITGILTSQTQLRDKNIKEPYYYAFIRLKGQTIDLPVIFKVKPALKKSDQVELTGYYSISEKLVRKSFTCLEYLVFNQEQREEKFFTNYA